MKNQGKVKALLDDVEVGTETVQANFHYLSCGKVEALGYFQLSDMRYDDINMVTKRVSVTVLQLYLI